MTDQEKLANLDKQIALNKQLKNIFDVQSLLLGDIARAFKTYTDYLKEELAELEKGIK